MPSCTASFRQSRCSEVEAIHNTRVSHGISRHVTIMSLAHVTWATVTLHYVNIACDVRFRLLSSFKSFFFWETAAWQNAQASTVALWAHIHWQQGASCLKHFPWHHLEASASADCEAFGFAGFVNSLSYWLESSSVVTIRFGPTKTFMRSSYFGLERDRDLDLILLDGPTSFTLQSQP